MLPVDRLKQTHSQIHSWMISGFALHWREWRFLGSPAGWWPREGRRLSLPVSLCFLGDSSNDCVFFMGSCPHQMSLQGVLLCWTTSGSQSLALKPPTSSPYLPSIHKLGDPPPTQLLVSGLSPWSLPCLSTIPSLCNPTLSLKDSFCVLVVFHKFLEVAFSRNSLSF